MAREIPRRLGGLGMTTLAVCLCFSAVHIQGASVEELKWLAGCWQSAGGEKRQITEHWMAPAGGTMLGISRTTAGGKTLEFEFIRIGQEENGDIFFVALPSGQKETRFKLIKLAENEAVFENPAHDFPQRVIYRRDGDTLTGRIEGTRDGQVKGIDFPYQRVACD